jgi:hypothetical protein
MNLRRLCRRLELPHSVAIIEILPGFWAGTRDLTRQILSRNGSEAELLLGRDLRFHFGEKGVEAGIGVKGLEVAVGLSIFEVEIPGVDGVPKKFESLVAMPSKSSATGEVIVRATEAGLARLLANGLNAIGIDFASFGIFAFDEKSGGEAGQGLERFGMIGAKDAALGF